MRALSILQPWAELIASGVKKIENRTWQHAHRGPVAIHAGKGKQCYKEDANVWEQRYEVRMPLVGEVAFGAIVAVAELIACVRLENLGRDFPELVGSRFAEGPWCWILKDARRIEPIACPGQQLLWTTSLISQ